MASEERSGWIVDREVHLPGTHEGCPYGRLRRGTPRGCPCRGGARPVARSGGVDGEMEGGAARGGAFGPDAAAVGLDQAAGDGEAQAGAGATPIATLGAGARTLAAVEAVEDAIHLVGADARAGVAHGDAHRCAVTVRLHADRPAGGRVAQRVIH